VKEWIALRRICRSLHFFMTGGIMLGACALRSVADENEVSENAAPAKSDEIKRLIDRLGSKRFNERDQATQGLSRLGKCALPC
jgi:hypothetical protein